MFRRVGVRRDVTTAPLMTGSPRSHSTRSGRSLSLLCNAARPLLASITRNPANASAVRGIRRGSVSSSTMRIVRPTTIVAELGPSSISHVSGACSGQAGLRLEFAARSYYSEGSRRRRGGGGSGECAEVHSEADLFCIRYGHAR